MTENNQKIYKYNIFITIVFIPLQIIASIIFNYYLARTENGGTLQSWYVFFSMTSVFILLEFSFPSLAVSYFNTERDITKRKVHYFIKKSLSIIIPLQIFIILVYSYLFNRYFLFFGIGLLFRSIGNILNSYIYSCGYIVKDKIYKFIYSISMPILFLVIIFIYKYPVGFNILICIWLISSLIPMAVSIYNYIKNSCCLFSDSANENIKIPFTNNMKLFFTTLPAIFIYTLSINYISIFGSNNDISSTILYGFFLQLFNIYNIIIILIPSYFIPNLSRLHYEGNDISKLIFGINDIVIALSICAISFVCFFGRDISIFIFQNKISNIPLLYIPLISIIFFIETSQVVFTNIGTALGIYNYHRQSLVSAILVLILSFILIPNYEIIGLFISIIIAQITTCFIFNPYIVLSSLKIPIKLYLYRIVCTFIIVIIIISAHALSYLQQHTTLYYIILYSLLLFYSLYFCFRKIQVIIK